jgi:hypothetical protein
MLSAKNMKWIWEKMSVEEFAAFERILGKRVIEVRGNHWSHGAASPPLH